MVRVEQQGIRTPRPFVAVGSRVKMGTPARVHAAVCTPGQTKRKETEMEDQVARGRAPSHTGSVLEQGTILDSRFRPDTAERCVRVRTAPERCKIEVYLPDAVYCSTTA